MMTDHIAVIGHSTIQHGSANSRIYLMKLNQEDLPDLLDTLDEMARQHHYTKIFAKVSAQHWPIFQTHDFRREAEIPDFYEGTSALFLGRYLDPKRAVEPNPDLVQENLKLARAKAGQDIPKDTTEIREMGPEDTADMAALYRLVFASYPFPIHEPDYLRETMQTNVRYFGIHQEGSLVALASAEMDRDTSSVEMTDFATNPTFRGHGYAALLLRRMEKEMAAEGLRTAFTIARAYSAGMNITFAKLGYTFGGTLTANTDISGQIESMNIWYKALRS